MNRIERSNKSVSERLANRKKAKRNRIFNIGILVFIVFFLPIYPVFGNLLYQRTGGILEYEIDEESILSSFEFDEAQPKTFSVDEDGFIEPAIAIEEQRDWGDREDIAYYTVRSGDTLSKLAESFNLDSNTIKWANGISGSTLKTGKKLTILPMDGVIHKVVKNDGIKKLSEKYKIGVSEILAANNFSEVQDLQVGQSIIIPGGKPLPKPKPPTPVYTNTGARSGDHSYAGATEYLASVDGAGYYPLNLKVSSGCRNFAWGHCTCFVAKYKNVTWRGNAKDWLRNAQKQGVSTGSTPVPGAIAVYRGPGTHPYWGHVSIVRKLNGDGTMIVTDMNYRRLNEVTTRREKVNHRAIIGYIYVD